MAFHRGVAQALLELHTGMSRAMECVGAVSTVSGGSVFAAALWCSSQNQNHMERLEIIASELRRGFVGRALRVLADPIRMARLFTGRYGRTERLAEVFAESFGLDGGLSGMPESPSICFNAASMNNNHVARFTRNGFSGMLGGGTSDYEVLELEDRWSIALAAATSAAFPFGLSPVRLYSNEFCGAVNLGPDLLGHRYLLLTDGGVLENLGVQTLLKSRSLGARHIIVSDAATEEVVWRPGWRPGRLAMDVGAAALTPWVLKRLLNMMNDKQNRSMRRLAWLESHSPIEPPHNGLVSSVRLSQGAHVLTRILESDIRLAQTIGAKNVPANLNELTAERTSLNAHEKPMCSGLITGQK